MSSPKTVFPHPRAAFQYRDFRFFLAARFLSVCAHFMLMVAVGQYVYEITHDPLHLGYVGLSLFLPKFLFTLFAGHAADRFDRRAVILACRSAQFLCVSAIVVYTLFYASPWVLYLLLFLLGTAYSFDGPPSQALVPQLVPEEHFSNAITWGATFFQIAVIAGPALGGWLYALMGKAATVFAAVAVIRFFSALLVSFVRPRGVPAEKTDLSLKTFLAGLHYVFKTKLILGTISMDLFAVLLGGATALLPIFANEILHVGPAGLGLLRAAPAAGAALIAILMAHGPPMKNAGRTMMICVTLFGISTVLFALSRNFYLSLAILAVLGAADMISVIIRGVLVQMKTPPEMRGRVSAVNIIFIGASNELGEFESGVTASWFGVIPSVIIGGVGTLLVVLAYWWKFPEIREYRELK